MPDFGPSTLARAEAERFDQAFAELKAKAKRSKILLSVFGGINVIFSITAAVLNYKVPAILDWLNILFFVIFIVLFGATMSYGATSRCLEDILARCRYGARHLLPIHYLTIKPGDDYSPGIIENMDKPLLLLPLGPDLHIPEISERDKQAAIEDALSRAKPFWYHAEALTPAAAVISARSLQPAARETPQPEGV
ncbi:uncharacterized protein N7496_000308 [Penicillium cataractarum]|uniref:Uncharacterized protein n=1 Tax=Penicillium cataractarum TaxID=2100454 RepID=A0A9X0B5V5_9EURO|nr:uncharacterized protein N7496_000308 [Penicillium cataractarum]KAJ5389240.1 hypothetical protein N7496_000308 [Penicillium cataractarum]